MRHFTLDGLVKSQNPVTPAKAGVHNILEYLGSRFRGNDGKGVKWTFYEAGILGLFFLSVVFLGQAFAGEIKEFELTDGTNIVAEIISFSNGTFTLKSESLGTFEIKESKIRAIRSRRTSGTSEDEIHALQAQMMGNEELFAMILSLQGEPEFQAILQDPEIMRAIGSGDISALLSNPRFMKLLEHPVIQDIGEIIEE